MSAAYDVHIPAIRDFGGSSMSLADAHQKLKDLGIPMTVAPEGVELNDFECHNPDKAVLFDVRDERVLAVGLTQDG